MSWLRMGEEHVHLLQAERWGYANVLNPEVRASLQRAGLMILAPGMRSSTGFPKGKPVAHATVLTKAGHRRALDLRQQHLDRHPVVARWDRRNLNRALGKTPPSLRQKRRSADSYT